MSEEEDEDVIKIVIICNHDDEHSVMSAMVMGAAVAATGDQPLMFFQPGAAKVLVKGGLEKYQGLKGQPDPLDLYESIRVLEGRFILCELGLPIWDIKKEDLREGVELMMASSFLFDAEGATMSFSY